MLSWAQDFGGWLGRRSLAQVRVSVQRPWKNRKGIEKYLGKLKEFV